MRRRQTYEDFYPYLPGSLDARQRMRKRLLKLICYSFGGFIVFISGFLLGLAWYESPPTQTALQQHPQLKITRTSPFKTSTPLAKLVVPDLEPQPIPPSESTSHPTLEVDTDTDTDKTLTETDTLWLPPIMPGSDTTAPPSHQQGEASVDTPAETVSQADTRQPRKQVPLSRPYLVQVGAFRNEANARSIVAQLRDKGYQPFIRTVPDRQNLVWYRVFLDRAQDKAQAQATAKAFEEAEKMDALVMLAGRLAERSDASSR
jgi:cell division septation protein DedD